MNRNRSYKGAFIVSLMFNIILLMMLTVIGVNSTKRAEIISSSDVTDTPDIPIVSLADAVVSEADIIEIDVPSEEDGMGDGEDLVEVTTTTPAPVVTTTGTAASATTARKTTAGTTRATTAKTTKATTTPAPTTTTQKPTTTTTKGSGDNDSEMDWSGFH